MGFLVVQWWKIHLPMQETWVWSLVQEGNPWSLSCSEATKRVGHSSWAGEQQLLKPVSPGNHALQQGRPLQWEARVLPQESGPYSPKLEKAHMAMKEDSAQPPPKKIMIEGYPFCFWDASKILTPVLSAGYSDVLSLWYWAGHLQYVNLFVCILCFTF